MRQGVSLQTRDHNGTSSLHAMVERGRGSFGPNVVCAITATADGECGTRLQRVMFEAARGGNEGNHAEEHCSRPRKR